jgi:hypothetical protein
MELENKIFKKVEWLHSDIHGRGDLLGYYIGKSEDQLKEKYKVEDEHISFIEITIDQYRYEKQKAEEVLNNFNLKV